MTLNDDMIFVLIDSDLKEDPNSEQKPKHIEFLEAPLVIDDDLSVYCVYPDRLKKSNIYDDFLYLFNEGKVFLLYPKGNTSGLIGIVFDFFNLKYSEFYKMSKIVNLQEMRQIILKDFLYSMENGAKAYASPKLLEGLCNDSKFKNYIEKHPPKFVYKDNLTVVVADLHK